MSEVKGTLTTYVTSLKTGSLPQRRKFLSLLVDLASSNAEARQIVTENSVLNEGGATWASLLALAVDVLESVAKTKSRTSQKRMWDSTVRLVDIAEGQGHFLGPELERAHVFIGKSLLDERLRVNLASQISALIRALVRVDAYARSDASRPRLDQYFALFSRSLLSRARDRPRGGRPGSGRDDPCGGDDFGDDDDGGEDDGLPPFLPQSPFVCAQALRELICVHPGPKLEFIERVVFPFYARFFATRPGDGTTEVELMRGLNHVLHAHALTAVGPLRTFAGCVVRYISSTWLERRKHFRFELVRFLRIVLRVSELLPSRTPLESVSGPEALRALLKIASNEIIASGEILYTSLGHDAQPAETHCVLTLNEASYDFLQFVASIVRAAERVRRRPPPPEKDAKGGKVQSAPPLQHNALGQELDAFLRDAVERQSPAALQFLFVLLGESPEIVVGPPCPHGADTSGRPSPNEILASLVGVARDGSDDAAPWAYACLCRMAPICRAGDGGVSSPGRDIRREVWAAAWGAAVDAFDKARTRVRRVALLLMTRLVAFGLAPSGTGGPSASGENDKGTASHHRSLFTKPGLADFLARAAAKSGHHNSGLMRARTRGVKRRRAGGVSFASRASARPQSASKASSSSSAADRATVISALTAKTVLAPAAETKLGLLAVQHVLAAICAAAPPRDAEAREFLCEKCIADIPVRWLLLATAREAQAWSRDVSKVVLALAYVDKRGWAEDTTPPDCAAEYIAVTRDDGGRKYFDQMQKDLFLTPYDGTGPGPFGTEWRSLQYGLLVTRDYLGSSSSNISSRIPSRRRSQASRDAPASSSVAREAQRRLFERIMKEVKIVSQRISNWLENNPARARPRDPVGAQERTNESVAKLIHMLHVVTRALQRRSWLDEPSRSVPRLAAIASKCFTALRNALFTFVRLGALPPPNFAAELRALLSAHRAAFAYCVDTNPRAFAGLVRELVRAFITSLDVAQAAQSRKAGVRYAGSGTHRDDMDMFDDAKVEHVGAATVVSGSLGLPQADEAEAAWDQVRGLVQLMLSCAREFGGALPPGDPDSKILGRDLDRVMELRVDDLRAQNLFFKLELFVMLTKHREKPTQQLDLVLQDVDGDFQSGDFDLEHIVEFLRDVVLAIDGGAIRLLPREHESGARTRDAIDRLVQRLALELQNGRMRASTRLALTCTLSVGAEHQLFDCRALLMRAFEDSDYPVRLCASRQVSQLVPLSRDRAAFFAQVRAQIVAGLDQIVMPRQEGLARTLVATLCQFALASPEFRADVLLELCRQASSRPQLLALAQQAYTQLCCACEARDETAVPRRWDDLWAEQAASDRAMAAALVGRATGGTLPGGTGAPLLERHLSYIIQEWFATPGSTRRTLRDFPFAIAADGSEGKLERRGSDFTSAFEAIIVCAALLTPGRAPLDEVADLLGVSAAGLLRRNFAHVFVRVLALRVERPGLKAALKRAQGARAKGAMDELVDRVGAAALKRLARNHDAIVTMACGLVAERGSALLPACSVEVLAQVLKRAVQHPAGQHLGRVLCGPDAGRLQKLLLQVRLWLDDPHASVASRHRLVGFSRHLLCSALAPELHRAEVFHPALTLALWLSRPGRADWWPDTCTASGVHSGRQGEWKALRLLRDFCRLGLRSNPQALASRLADTVRALMVCHRSSESNVEVRGGRNDPEAPRDDEAKTVLDLDEEGNARAEASRRGHACRTEIAGVLDLVLVQALEAHQAIFRPRIHELSPLPRAIEYSRASAVYRTVCSGDGLLAKVRRFLDNFAGRNTSGGALTPVQLCPAHAVQQLLRELETRACDKELLDPSSDLRRALVRLQRLLLRLSADADRAGPDARAHATKALSLIELPGDATDPAAEGVDDAATRITTGATMPYVRVVKRLAGVLRDDDPAMAWVAAVTLRDLFSAGPDATSVWKSLPSDLRARMAPYRARATRAIAAAPRQAVVETPVEQRTPTASDAWIKTLWLSVEQPHPRWVARLAGALAKNSSNPVLRCCARLCLLRPSFASALLPLLVMDRVGRGLQAPVAAGSSRRHFQQRGTISAANNLGRLASRFVGAHAGSIDPAIMYDVFGALDWVRKQTSAILRQQSAAGRNRRVISATTQAISECCLAFDAALDKLTLAHAAHELGLHYTALLLAETHWMGARDTGAFTENREGFLLDDDGFLSVLKRCVGAPRAGSKQEAKGKADEDQAEEDQASVSPDSTVRHLLGTIYREIGDPDAVYGLAAGGRGVNDPEEEVLLSEHEGKWDQVVQMYDSLIVADRERSARNASGKGGLHARKRSRLGGGPDPSEKQARKHYRTAEDPRRRGGVLERVAKVPREGDNHSPGEMRQAIPVGFKGREGVHCGLARALLRMGCPRVLQAYMQHLSRGDPDVYARVTEQHFEVAWRAARWGKTDVPIAGSSAGFHESIFGCLSAVRDRNAQALGCRVDDALVCVQRDLESVAWSPEGLTAALPHLSRLHVLRDLGSVRKLLAAGQGGGVGVDAWRGYSRAVTKRAQDLRGKFSLVEPALTLGAAVLEVSGLDAVLGAHLREAARMAREARRPYACRRFLERARPLHARLHLLDSLELHLEEARLLWDTGEQQAAVRKGTNLVRRLRGARWATLQSSQRVSPRAIVAFQVELHCLLGDWLFHTLSEGTKMINQVLLSALQPVQTPLASGRGVKQTDLTDAEFHRVHYQLGRFHDAARQRLVAQRKSFEYRRSVDLMHRNEKRIVTLQQLQAQNKGRVCSKSDLKGLINTLRKNIAIDRKLHRVMDESVQESLVSAVRFYITCLWQGERYNNEAMYRLVSLWFSNSADQELAQLLESSLGRVASHKFLPLVYQIVSRLKLRPAARDPKVRDHDARFRSTVYRLVKRMAAKHPHHTLYSVFAIANGDKLHERARLSKGHKIDIERKRAAKKMIGELKARALACAPAVCATEELIDAFIKLSNSKLLSSGRGAASTRDTINLRSVSLGHLARDRLAQVPVPTRSLEARADGDYSRAPRIDRFGNTIRFANTGISRPMIIECRATDGVSVRQLVKPRDDLRQDAVMEQVFRLVNRLLAKHVQTRRRRLAIRTYNVVPFTPCVGLVEWVEDTISIGDYLTRNRSGAHTRYARPGQRWMNTTDIQRYLLAADAKEPLRERFSRVCRDYRPVFRHFFHEYYPDPCQWFAKRTTYTRSVAASSIVGYVVGLGDRHCQNILVDKTSAEIVHIDLGVAFEQGRVLKTPEIVPFRLTRDIVDGMGPAGVEGVFRRCCEETMKVLRKSKEQLMTVLEVFVHDPLYKWALSPEKALQLQGGEEEEEAVREEQETGKMEAMTEGENREAQRALSRVKAKLQGVESERTLSVEGQIKALVSEARDPENLHKMFVGWCAWA